MKELNQAFDNSNDQNSSELKIRLPNKYLK